MKLKLGVITDRLGEAEVFAESTAMTRLTGMAVKMLSDLDKDEEKIDQIRVVATSLSRAGGSSCARGLADHSSKFAPATCLASYSGAASSRHDAATPVPFW